MGTEDAGQIFEKLAAGKSFSTSRLGDVCDAQRALVTSQMKKSGRRLYLAERVRNEFQALLTNFVE